MIFKFKCRGENEHILIFFAKSETEAIHNFTNCPIFGCKPNLKAFSEKVFIFNSRKVSEEEMNKNFEKPIRVQNLVELSTLEFIGRTEIV